MLFTDDLAIPNARTWTISGEFLGEDPGVEYSVAARGRVGSVNTGSGSTLSVTNTVSEDVSTTRLFPILNKGFAFMIANRVLAATSLCPSTAPPPRR